MTLIFQEIKFGKTNATNIETGGFNECIQQFYNTWKRYQINSQIK